MPFKLPFKLTMAWKIAIAVILIVVGFVIFALVSNRLYKDENKQLLKDKITAEAVVEKLNDDIDKTEKSVKATDEVVTRTVEKIKKQNQQETVIRGSLAKKLERITRTKEEKVEEIKKSPAPPAKKEELIKEAEKTEQRAVNEAHVTSVWEHYCLTVDHADEECRASQEKVSKP